MWFFGFSTTISNKHLGDTNGLPETSTPNKSLTTEPKPKLFKKILDQQVKLGTDKDSTLTSAFEIEIDTYLRDIMVDENPLQFFKTYQRKYPLLSGIVKRLMHVTATSVPAESLFSQTGLIDTELRNRLSAAHLEKLVFLKENDF